MEELEHILAALVDATSGATAAAVGSMDGLLVERFPQGAELEALVAEQTTLLRSSRAAFAAQQGAGELQDLALSFSGLSAYSRVLSPDLFVLVLMAPSGDVGAARRASENSRERILELLV